MTGEVLDLIAELKASGQNIILTTHEMGFAREIADNDILISLKVGAMGAANVIPGVSGGTVAFITGIYERLINAIKSFDLNAIALLIKFRLNDFSLRIDLRFLFAIGIGALISVLSLAKILDSPAGLDSRKKRWTRPF